MNYTQSSVSVPLRQCLVMSVVYGDSHQLPANLFGPELVRQVVVGVTGEDPEQLFYSSVADILMVYKEGADINRIRLQLECQANWMGKPIHLQCVRPSGLDLRKFGVVGTIPPPYIKSRWEPGKKR